MIAECVREACREVDAKVGHAFVFCCCDVLFSLRYPCALSPSWRNHTTRDTIGCRDTEEGAIMGTAPYMGTVPYVGADPYMGADLYMGTAPYMGTAEDACYLKVGVRLHFS